MKKNELLRDRVIIKKRMLLTLFMIFIFFIGLIGRLCYVMIYKSFDYKKLAVNQWTNEVTIDAKRGRILDRNGNELAISGNVYRVDLDLNSLRTLYQGNTKKTTCEKISQDLAKALDMDEKKVYKIINSKRANGDPMGGAILKRRIEKDVADKVSALKLQGVLISPDTKRYYPNNNFLAQVIGHTDSDGVGLTGIEKYYNAVLSGTPGKKTSENDKSGNELPYSIASYQKPVDGKDVQLTIDFMIQSFCEKAADQALKDNKAKAVTIVAMDPKTGEILAMVNKPDYNPNDPWEKGKTTNELNEMWRNRAVSDSFEPGSIFKAVTASAAIDSGAISSSDRFTCTSSGFKIGNHTIHCAQGEVHGVEDIPLLLQNSCNVGFAQLGIKMGKNILLDYVNKFGFGHKTGIDINGEASGIVKSVKNTTESDLATISFGQTNTLTPVQYMAALNAIANGGKWIRPHLMKSIDKTDDNNKQQVVSKYNNFGETQIINAQTASTMRANLENVVTQGGGHNAFVEGYHIAGKTGTAQKPKTDGVGYDPSKYRSSFASMAPADDPKISLFVSVDEPDPSQYFASLVAAPVAKQLYIDIFNYLSLSPQGSANVLKDVVIPDLRGMSKSDSQSTLKKLNLDCEFSGSGDKVVKVAPIPGLTAKEGSKIQLTLGNESTYDNQISVPDFKGYGKTSAQQILDSLGLKGTFSGNGVVIKQSIEAGKNVTKGNSISFEMKDDSD